MRKRTLEDLEFFTILEMIRAYSLSVEGAKSISEDALTQDEEILNSRCEKITNITKRLSEHKVQLQAFPSLEHLFTSYKVQELLLMELISFM